jgi:acetyl-CoA synthetase
MSGCVADHLDYVLSSGRAGLLQPGDIHLQNAMAAADLTMTTPVNNSEDPLFLLFTSGSTGAPKGLEHTSAGYLLQTAVTHQVGSVHAIACCGADRMVSAALLPV